MTLMSSRNRGTKAYLLRSNMWGCVVVGLFESLENVCTYVYQNANTLYLINNLKSIDSNKFMEHCVSQIIIKCTGTGRYKLKYFV